MRVGTVQMSALENYTNASILGLHGGWAAIEFDITQAEADHNNRRAAAHSFTGTVEPGRYKALVEADSGRLWMSNVPFETEPHAEFVRRAHGRVLVTGLGLGLVPTDLARKESVTEVTVVEKEPSVIALTPATVYRELEEHEAAKIRLICANAYSWRPDHRYEFAWHDIWPAFNVNFARVALLLMRVYDPRVRVQEAWPYIALGFESRREAADQLRPVREDLLADLRKVDESISQDEELMVD